MGFRHVPRQEPLPKVPKVPPPRAYDRTPEENAATVAADVKRQLAPRKPEPKKIFTPKQKKEQPSQIEINRPDDYLRCMRRVRSHTTTSSSASGKRDIAQLGEQAKQSISPLKVLPTDQGSAAGIALSYAAEFAAEAGITLSQLESEDIPISDVEVWKWEYGKPLLPPDQIELLPTQMRKLHNWYLQVTKEERKMIVVKVTKDHFIGEDEVHIYLEELSFLYKLDALELSLISTYCL